MSSIVHRVLRCLGLPVNGCFLQQLTEPEFPSRFRFYTESEPLPTSLISVSCS